jgi:phosphonatase-like hydrolase
LDGDLVTSNAFELAALDMAGTTVDEGGLVYRVLDSTVADAVGTPVPADLLQRWKGTSKREAIGGLLEGLGADASDDAVDKTFASFTERLIAAYRETPPAPFPGMIDVFAALRRAGVKVALQTGYSADIVDSILAGLGWTVGPSASATVDAVVTSDLVPASRPAPYLIFRCMEQTAVTDVRRVLVAGDTPHDLQAGTNAGAGLVVGVGTGSFTLDQLACSPHTHLLASATDLPTLL